MGKDKHARGLDALKGLKNRVPAAAPSRPRIVIPAQPAEPDDATLFRREVGRIQPLKADDHAEIARPKPAPLPRPQTFEPAPETPFLGASNSAWTVDFAGGNALGTHRQAKAALRLVRVSANEEVLPRALALASPPRAPARQRQPVVPVGSVRPAAPTPISDVVTINRPLVPVTPPPINFFPPPPSGPHCR